MTYSLSVLVGVEKNLSREARLSVDFFLERKLTNGSHSAREDLSATKECSVFPYVISPVFAPRHVAALTGLYNAVFGTNMDCGMVMR